MSYSKLLKEIMYDEDNISYTEKGIKPLFSAFVLKSQVYFLMI